MALTDNARASLAELQQRAGTLDVQLTDIQTVHDREIAARDARIAELEQALADCQAPPPADPEPVLEPAPEPEPAPVQPTGPIFSVDLGNIPGTPDAQQTEAQKIAAHKQLLGVPALNDLRVFFGGGVPSWSDERIRACDPAAGDTILISTLTTDWGALASFFANTPDEWRGHVRVCYGHEREAQLMTPALLSAWLDGNARTTDAMTANGYSEDDFGKVTLYYSQEIDTRAGLPTREQMHGGQDWGWFGEDCYHPRARLTRGVYTPPAQLLGPILDFCESVGRPAMIPEWGGERAEGDTDGTLRAAAIADGGNYLKSRHGQNGLTILGANWWCANGLRDGVVLYHHLDIDGPGSPELAAYRSLIHA